MSYSQKYCLVSFIDPVDKNSEFAVTDWPLHVTLADVFAVDLSADVIKGLTELLTKQPPVTTTAHKEAVLGEVKVVLLDKNDELLELHTTIVDFLASHGAAYNNPEFTKEGFLPHCTIQKSGKIHIGDRIHIDTVSLIDMFPNRNWQQRKVLRNFKLKGM